MIGKLLIVGAIGVASVGAFVGSAIYTGHLASEEMFQNAVVAHAQETIEGYKVEGSDAKSVDAKVEPTGGSVTLDYCFGLRVWANDLSSGQSAMRTVGMEVVSMAYEFTCGRGF